MHKLFLIITISLIGFNTTFAQKKPARPTPAPATPTPQTPSVSFGSGNTVYVNIENPVTINVSGVATTDVQVSCEDVNLSITNMDNGKYTFKPFQEGTYTVAITSVVDWRTTSYSVSAKSIPLPTPMLMLNSTGLRKGGDIVANIFKGATAMLAQVENFEFDAKCGVASFTLTYIGKKQDPIVLENQGPMFNASIVSTIQKCKPGDFYIFSNIKVKMPNETDPRPVDNTIAYFIK